MTTDNRTNEPTEAEWLEGIDPMTERERMEDAMTTDNRTNEPTPEQVEAVANAICEAFPHSGGGSKIVYEEAEHAARAALVAAHGAAPQAESDPYREETE